MTLIHEMNLQGQHRIHIVEEGKEVDAGEWAQGHELAEHKGYFANSDFSNHLPPGIFRVREHAYQVVA